MRTKFRSPVIRFIITAVLIILLGYSVFKMAITGSLLGAIPVAFQYLVLCLLFAQSVYLPKAIKIWGILIVATGIVKLVLLGLSSSGELGNFLENWTIYALVLLGCFVWWAGEYSLIKYSISDDENQSE